MQLTVDLHALAALPWPVLAVSGVLIWYVLAAAVVRVIAARGHFTPTQESWDRYYADARKFGHTNIAGYDRYVTMVVRDESIIHWLISPLYVGFYLPYRVAFNSFHAFGWAVSLGIIPPPWRKSEAKPAA